MDSNVLLTLLTLSEKLQGHPRLSGMKTLVDEQINKMQIDSDEEVKRLYVDRKAYQDKIAAEQAAIVQGQTVTQRAVGAHERVDQVEFDKQQAERDAATISEADKFAADQPKTDAEARVLAEQNVNPGTGPRAIPASPAIEPFAPPEGSSKWLEERNANSTSNNNPVPAPYVPQTESPLIDTPVSPSTTTNGTSTGRRI
jgi:hypothetical protein